MYNRPM